MRPPQVGCFWAVMVSGRGVRDTGRRDYSHLDARVEDHDVPEAPRVRAGCVEPHGCPSLGGGRGAQQFSTGPYSGCAQYAPPYASTGIVAPMWTQR